MSASLIKSKVKDLAAKNQRTIHLAVIFISTIAVYLQVYQFDFLIGWDDQWFVTNYYTEDGFTGSNLFAILSEYYYGQYAPLNQLYYTSLYALFGYNPGYYHLGNLLIHVLNTVLVYKLIKTLCIDLFNLRDDSGHIAFLTTLVFAIMPVNVEPVAWVGASKVLLYALFYLLSLISYIGYIKTFKPKYFYLTLFFYVLAFAGKEQALLLPVCMILFDYLYGRSLKSKLVWIEKIPVFILSFLFGLIAIAAQKVEDGDFYTLFERVPLSAYTLSEYFTKCILPINVSYLYPFPFLKGESIPAWMWLHVIAIPTILYCLFFFLKKRWVAFGLLFFFVHIILVSNILSLARFSVVADRYTYVSSIGICFLVATTFLKLRERVAYRSIPNFAMGLYICGLMLYSYFHLPVWANAYTLKEKVKNTIEKREDFKIQNK